MQPDKKNVASPQFIFYVAAVVTETPLRVTAENLRELRKCAGLTQTECGALVGVDKFAICRAETGLRPLTVAESLVLGAALLGHPVPVVMAAE